MEDTLSDKMREARKSQNLSQGELANRCRLDIRTIQRIESGEVIPRPYTLRILNKELGTDYSLDTNGNGNSSESEKYYRDKFRKKRKVRIALVAFSLTFLIIVGIVLIMNWDVFGMPRRIWAPFVYVIMFAVLISIGLVWRCPGCNALLGDVFNTRYCSKCGLELRK